MRFPLRLGWRPDWSWDRDFAGFAYQIIFDQIRDQRGR